MSTHNDENSEAQSPSASFGRICATLSTAALIAVSIGAF